MLLLSLAAHAAVDVRCDAAPAGAAPGWYTDDEAQLDFVLNRLGLATTFSPLHGAFAAEPGKVSLQLEAVVTPPLSCERRFYADRASTADTNHTPVLPRPRIGFATKPMGRVVLYGGAGFIPPIPLGTTTTVVASGEAGIGMATSDTTAVSVRAHFSHARLTANLFPPLEPGEALLRDFYDGSTFGLDLVSSFVSGPVEPYLAVGVVDVSTFAWAGEDGSVVNNHDPYAGLAVSVGSELHVKRFAGAGEVYAVPGQLLTVRLSAGASF
jgi:hypothetical protein